eukprot:TRINITY_DN59439_c0_g1_i1.p1 TRINITY_DN59439_c0_g1~~TRINITY_DN59439_c0_g1_i1.p1  ORF type:complete len:142 (-),score=36.50 TRINITY_DN59439_c0_g1_i1:91-516(-)
MAEELPPGPQIDVTRLEISPPGICRYGQDVKLQIWFSSNTPLPSFYWRVTCMVDTTRRRKIIDLGNTPLVDYPDGENYMEFDYPGQKEEELPEDLKKARDWMLSATLTSHAGEEYMSVNMVVKISEDEHGQLYREIFNPMD